MAHGIQISSHNAQDLLLHRLVNWAWVEARIKPRIAGFTAVPDEFHKLVTGTFALGWQFRFVCKTHRVDDEPKIGRFRIALGGSDLALAGTWIHNRKRKSADKIAIKKTSVWSTENEHIERDEDLRAGLSRPERFCYKQLGKDKKNGCVVQTAVG